MQRTKLVLLATLFALSSGIARAQISDDVVKIGVLTDLSGPAATATGPGSVAAAQMAVEDFGGKVLGKPIQVISADHQIKPDLAAGIARQWYDRDQVDLIVDVPVSAVGLAVQNVANERKKLFITHSTGTADFHGKFCNPYAIQWVFDTHALAVGTAQEVTKRGGNSWFFLTADYAFGHALERDASQVIIQNGGKVLGSVAHPFATPDLSSFILQAQASKAKIIGIASGPPDNVNAIKLGGEFGIFQGGQQMAGLLVLITDINALGLKAAQGLLLTTSFYWDMDDQTRAWSKRFFARVRTDADDVAGRRLFLDHELSERDQGDRDRRPAQGYREDARSPHPGLLRPQRKAARRQSDGSRPRAGRGQDAGRIKVPVGFL